MKSDGLQSYFTRHKSIKNNNLSTNYGKSNSMGKMLIQRGMTISSKKQLMQRYVGRSSCPSCKKELLEEEYIDCVVAVFGDKEYKCPKCELVEKLLDV